MSNIEVFTKFGKFSVVPGREVYGELHMAGKETSLYLQDDEFFHPYSIPDRCVTGTLLDLTKVTLIQCITLEEGLGFGSRDGGRYYYAKLSPHFVLEGRQHIKPDDRAIFEIELVLEDATALFYDFDAFGTVINAVPHIERIVAANNLDRPIPIGPEPRITYFTGKREIIAVDTVLGRVRARHNPGLSLASLGGPHGVRIDNILSVNIEPESPVAFDEALSRTLRLLQFLELIIGRPQNLRELVMYVCGHGEHREPLKVHWSYRPFRGEDSTEERRSPHPADLLLDPINQPEEFACVMRAWLENDEERQDARQRFHTSFAHQRTYSVERLVGAANMFDILPESAVPEDVELSEELQEAKRHCQEIFNVLPKSYERDSVLSILGRVGKASLKHKTRHRASYVVNVIGERFPDFVSVLDAAIDCRNHYVHGSKAKIDYSRNFDMVIFFTDTLEFVFAASDLIEVGWNIRTFVEKATTMSHPFGVYRVEYAARLQALKALVAKR